LTLADRNIANGANGSGTPAPSTIISVNGVHKEFGDSRKPFIALGDVNLTIERGQFVCLVGPSGCGKSTLLNLIAGLDRPSSGHITYDGKRIDRVNSRVGYITQNDNLLPWRTLRKNVDLPLEIRHVPKAERAERSLEIIRRVGLEGFEDRFPAQLSGGMRKRVTLARTLVYDPETLLMDEPFGAVDAQMRMSLHADLLRIWERNRKTVIFVTHDLEEAMALGDRVVVMGTNPGRVLHSEQISFDRPRDVFSLRADPEFLEVQARLWDILGSELRRARDASMQRA
jgi:NitT/TauT family transport system ATP-binding protein